MNIYGKIKLNWEGELTPDVAKALTVLAGVAEPVIVEDDDDVWEPEDEIKRGRDKHYHLGANNLRGKVNTDKFPYILPCVLNKKYQKIFPEALERSKSLRMVADAIGVSATGYSVYTPMTKFNIPRVPSWFLYGKGRLQTAKEHSRKDVKKAVIKHEGNVSGGAKELGMNRGAYQMLAIHYSLIAFEIKGFDYAKLKREHPKFYNEMKWKPV